MINSFTARIPVGFYDCRKEYWEYDGKVEFDIRLTRYMDFDGEYEEVDETSVDIDKVLIIENGKEVDILPLIEKEDLLRLEKSCIDWVYAN